MPSSCMPDATQFNARTAGMVACVALYGEETVRMQAKRCSVQQAGGGGRRRGDSEEVGACSSCKLTNFSSLSPARSFLPCFLPLQPQQWLPLLTLSLSPPRTDRQGAQPSLCFLSLLEFLFSSPKPYFPSLSQHPAAAPGSFSEVSNPHELAFPWPLK